MRVKAWKGLLLAGSLVTAGAVATTPIPTKACVFLQEFEKSSKSRTKVSVWERIVYSLIEANHQTTERRAPIQINVSA